MTNLTDILPLPRGRAGDAGVVDTASAEFGAPLPADYWNYVRCYGPGSINDFIWIFTPGVSNEFLDLRRASARQREMLVTLRGMFPDEFPFAAYPESDGLLAFGVTDNGDILAWQTLGNDPDAWPIVILNPREPDYYVFDGGIQRLLVALIEGTYHCPLLPDDLFADGAVFGSYEDDQAL